jgi:hypothetical protein
MEAVCWFTHNQPGMSSGACLRWITAEVKDAVGLAAILSGRITAGDH